MKTYAGALALMTWSERLSMRCFSAWITVEAYLLPAHSKARAMRLARGE